MVVVRRWFTVVLPLILLVGCIQTTTPRPPLAFTPAPGQSAADAYEHWQRVQAAETAAVVGPTETAVAATRMIEEQQIAAEGTRLAEVTRDYHDLAIDKERVELQMAIDQATRQAQQEDAQATADANQAMAWAAQEARNHQAALRAAEDAARAQFWREIIWVVVLALSFLIVVGVVGWLLFTLGYQRFTAARSSQEVTAVENAPNVAGFIARDAFGNISLLKPQRYLVAPDDATDATPTIIDLPSQVPWERLVSWRDPLRLVLGVNVGTGQPVLLNRKRTPHLLGAGSSGAGKTFGLLLPYLVGAWGVGDHVLVFNGKGADFNWARDWPNVTLCGLNEDETAVLPRLVSFLGAARAEAGRRGEVLSRYGAHNWGDLPPRAGQPGQVVLAIDELVTLLDAASAEKEIARAEGDIDRAKMFHRYSLELWAQMLYLSSQGRKYGIFIVATLTDPTKEVLGKTGMALRRQCASVAFRMKPQASRSFLGDSSDSAHGLPTGRFLYDLGGESGEAVAFHPSESDLRHFRQAREGNVAPNPLPDTLLEAIEVAPGQFVTLPVSGNGNGRAPQNQPLGSAPRLAADVSQAHADAAFLTPYINDLNSLNAVAELLYGRSDTSGQDIELRVLPALDVRAAQGCRKSAYLRSRSSK